MSVVCTMAILTAALPFAANAHAQDLTLTRSADQRSVAGPAEWFTGSVTMQPLFDETPSTRASAASVTFKAGARTKWHTHPAGQHLIVTAGTGWVQQWGGAVLEIKTGDVVRIPPGMKHWHGATATTDMTHLAVHEHEGGKVVEWLEPVSDEQYRRTP